MFPAICQGYDYDFRFSVMNRSGALSECDGLRNAIEMYM